MTEKDNTNEFKDKGGYEKNGKAIPVFIDKSSNECLYSNVEDSKSCIRSDHFHGKKS